MKGSPGGDGVPILGRDLTVRLPRHHLEILKWWAGQKGVGLGQGAALLLGHELERMALAFCAELATVASGVARARTGT